MKRLMMMAVAAGMLLGCSPGNSFAASSFTGLGFLPVYTNSYASAVSGDGKVVVGWASPDKYPEYSYHSYNKPFRWTAEAGMVDLGRLPGGKFGKALAVSRDGLVVVGVCATDPLNQTFQAFRWTIDGGMKDLGNLHERRADCSATGVSDDGSVVVGKSKHYGCNEAFRWTAATGMVSLDNSAIKGAESSATGVSADGSIVVGILGSERHQRAKEAFRWTAAAGTQGLGRLPGEDFNSYATAVSADGSMVVGGSGGVDRNKRTRNPTWASQACRWTAAKGMVELDYLPECRYETCPKAVSGNGSVVVGWCEWPSRAKDLTIISWEKKAFIWDTVSGMCILQSVLTNVYRLNLSGWKLIEATGVSRDGNTIVGTGEHNGRTEAWIAHLDRPAGRSPSKEEKK
ncbi:MAG: PEP-CTERM sorting domain-containing protein [Verrucomicrobia bacterium]|nr:PEP-CTERM sorting domain-containing protein [Verrucomicrobiota bacterium]